MLDIEAETLADVKARNRPQGSLAIRVPQSIGNTYFPAVLGEFRTRFPLVNFHFHTCAFHSLEHELQTGVTDLAFLLAESIHSASLVAEPLRFERLVMISNPENPLARTAKVSARDLVDQAIFLPKFDCGYRMAFEQFLTEQHVKPHTVLEFNSVEMLKSCLHTSQGIAMIPEVMARSEIERGELSLVPWEEGELETAILMIRHKEKWLSPTLQAFIDISRSVIRGKT